MPVMLVTYDLNKETKRPPIVQKIKELSNDCWAELSESCYAVDYSGTVQSLYNSLKPLLDGNDQIYIISLKQPWTGFGPQVVNEWLDAKLP